MYKIILPFIFLISTFVACNETETCRENKDVFLQAGFIASDTSTATIDSLIIVGLEQDSVLHLIKNNIQNVNFPLNAQKETSIFVLNFNDEVRDTLFILHTNKEYFISYACGVVMTHSLDTVFSTTHFIDDVQILNHDINTTETQHVQIFY